MEILFANRRIRKICSSLQSMRKALGDVRANTLNKRIQQLQEATCLEDLRNLAGDWHELTQNRKGQIAASVGQPYRLVLEPSDDPPPTKPDGGLDWPKIISVTLLEVTDYH